jgi:hypothetical protein
VSIATHSWKRTERWQETEKRNKASEHVRVAGVSNKSVLAYLSAQFSFSLPVSCAWYIVTILSISDPDGGLELAAGGAGRAEGV